MGILSIIGSAYVRLIYQ